MNSKPWYESKTVIIAILQAVVGLVMIFGTQYPEIGLLAMAKSVLDIGVRLVTDLPIQ